MKLSEAREFALSLPEANEEPHFDYESFRVRGKIFATIPPDKKQMNVFVDEQRRELAISMFPKSYEKLWWGKKVVGIKVTLFTADAADVRDLLHSAWERKAPKGLAKAASK